LASSQKIQIADSVLGLKMASVDFNEASIEFPIFNANGRSLTSRLLQVATGGKLDADPNGRVVIRALDKLTFKLQDGDRVGLLGHNGAGKSTLLRALSRVYAPTSGSAVIKGEVGSLIDISLGINPEATGRENIFIRGALLGFSKQEIESRLEDVIEFSELGDFIEMPVRTYSSGMHLRLAFAVSTVVRPEILLMDEWLSVGDENFKQKAEARLADLVDATKILVIASHSRELIETSCNRAIWLEHGQIKMDGSASEVCAAYFG
jgi:lipopolysaccharide transport system ATP-binding protein